ncbi:hypothetical protein BN2476_1130007 [Paraburkholderia piptadeniae]|uniref:Uncharacterized protein n=1 Tax=Paraburkholderia piptadeniae TaxID=1701573 RepID=A0A1N7SUW6_9BURK|nr:hypothetical protein BN2476_1130007 [Paraburkholderia piptadeniae]
MQYTIGRRRIFQYSIAIAGARRELGPGINTQQLGILLPLCATARSRARAEVRIGRAVISRGRDGRTFAALVLDLESKVRIMPPT